MPLYDMMVLVRSAVSHAKLKNSMVKIGNVIFKENGVVTNIEYNGARVPLGYAIKTPGERHYHAQMYQFSFMLGADKLEKVRHELVVDDDVMRHVFVKKDKYVTSLKQLKWLSKREGTLSDFYPEPDFAKAKKK